MHIAYLTTEYPLGLSGGIGTSIQAMARALVRAGHRATVIGWGVPSVITDEGVAVRSVDTSHPPRLGWFVMRKRLAAEIKAADVENPIDVVEAPDWGGISAAVRTAMPLVVRCHGSDSYFGHLLGYQPRPSVYYAERMALGGADHVTAVSKFTSTVTAEVFGLSGLPRILHNGVDIDCYMPQPSSEEPTILYFGSIVRKKGVLDLCQAMNDVARRPANVSLQLVGRDAADRASGASSTWQLCEESLSDVARARTRYSGPRDLVNLLAALRQSRVCCFPSYAEALPMTWLEAMACARPIVAYDIGWASELVVHGQTGLLVPRGDVVGLAEALWKLLESRALAEEMGAAARDRVVRLFSSDIAASRTLDCYEALT